MSILADAPLWDNLMTTLQKRNLTTRGATAREQETVFRELLWKAESESGTFRYKRWAIN